MEITIKSILIENKRYIMAMDNTAENIMINNHDVSCCTD